MDTIPVVKMVKRHNIAINLIPQREREERGKKNKFLFYTI